MQSAAHHALVVYSNRARGFCSFHDEEDEQSNIKNFMHGSIVCPPEPECGAKGFSKQTCLENAKDKLLKAINSKQNPVALERYSFNMTRPMDVRSRDAVDKHLRHDATSVQMTSGFDYANLKNCKRDHVMRGNQYHHDGQVRCGLFADPDIFTVRKIKRSPEDAHFEIGYSREHRLCGVGADKMFTCRDKCDFNFPNLGCRHKNDTTDASGRFQVFEVVGKLGDLSLRPWKGPYKRIK